MNNATASSVFIQSGSNLVINGGTIQGIDNDGLEVTNSTATVSNARINGDFLGLSVNRVAGTSTGSQVTLDSSAITGGEEGAQVTGASTLSLANSTVTGTGIGSRGINLLGGAAIATGSQISGQSNGVRITHDIDRVGDPSLVLEGSRVEGRTGAAILVERDVIADIAVRNGSTLVGADDLLIQVRNNSTANVDVVNSNLDGIVRVAADSSANLTLEQASWSGDFEVEAGGNGTLNLQSQASFSGRLVNVSQLDIGDQSSYSMVENTRLETLNMAGGTVNMGSGSNFYLLNVDNLSGTGVIKMNVDYSTNTHDRLTVNQNASGNFELWVPDSGVDPVAPEQLTLVNTAAGDAQFSLINGRAVAVGAWSYELSSASNGNGGTEWFLDPQKRTVSPATRSVMALFNTAPTVWYGEMTSLRSRMGELRFNGSQPGLWMRSYGNQYNVADGSGTGYQQNQHGLSLGADGRLPWGDGQWLIGALAGYSRSDLDLNEGTSGTVDSYYLGAYTTWLDAESGYYFDGVAKFNRFQNKAKVAVNDGSHAKGDYDNLGMGVSAEFGRHIPLSSGYFIEPFTQWSAVVIQGDDYHLSNDLQADGDQTRSLLGKAGLTAGKTFELASGGKLQPYLRAAMAHEFINNNEVQVNNNRFNNDLSGSRGELGAGLALGLASGLQVHVDLEYANGKHIEQPYGANLGLRYSF
ncbi:autotransporter outer membrane beta-barrel domain-containing protein [Pseudomonas putida]|uniref:autotransporter outer membrane beta-barrel domain-containing protein n=1 Tax=Pseudomonas putida TaxID=303 RepID=UPI002365C31B|nr:autotransporter outer membrane beta-barrel domain-containing protein [Pseudomonas putida]MDD2046560.1 autotransporter outer membrane beta-barrel domain-containing protein [Pseudomonas putida]